MTSITSCWCANCCGRWCGMHDDTQQQHCPLLHTFRDFMVRTIAASMAYWRSLATSSTTFLRSSTGGNGTLMRRARSANLLLMRNESPLLTVRPSGLLSRILYLAHDSECSSRAASSSETLRRVLTSSMVSTASVTGTM